MTATGIDLNCDMGELWPLQTDGTQARLVRAVSSVNIACGAHAGDEALIAATVRLAREAGVVIGAHPGYPDRANFGRVPLNMPGEALKHCIVEQLRTLAAVAEFVHVKPHGALYNQAAVHREIARVITDAVAEFSRDLLLVGLAGSVMLDEFASAGFGVVAEAFADRRYAHDGTLRSRTLPGAVIESPEEAAAQALAIVQRGEVVSFDGTPVAVRADTICLHSDTPGSADAASHIRGALISAGIAVLPPAFPRIPKP
jgi:5-oxoprolinase (ATP-hydrolysing) subunit A